MTAWLPIEKEPMATTNGCRQHLLISNGSYVMIGWYNTAAGCWYNVSCNKIMDQPTHYQPLPDPPTPRAHGAALEEV